MIPYDGPNSTNPLAFKFYNPDQIVMGKPMKEHLPFAMAWWHNLCAGGTDMFGRDTADKSFGAEKGTMEHAQAKVDAGFEFMQKLGIEYFCFHDVDIVPEADDIKETTCAEICINAARKVDSGSVRPESRPWPTCLAMTAPALVLLPSHSSTQWGQLGEILGGVQFP